VTQQTPDIERLLNDALEATAWLGRTDVTEDATVNDLGFRLHAVDTILAAFTEHRQALAIALAETMETDTVTVPHVGQVRRTWKAGSAQWDTETVRRDIREKILRRVALDPSTGELNPVWRGVAANTIEWVARTWGLNAPKTGTDSGIRALELDVDNYRSFGAGRWEVKVVGGE
jgi:hypothetical protein